MTKRKPQRPRQKFIKPPLVELTASEVEALLQRAEAGELNEKDLEVLRSTFETLLYLGQVVDQKSQSLKRLLQMLFGSKTEKAKDILKSPSGGDGDHDITGNPPSADDTQPKGDSGEVAPPPPGHGKNGQEDYHGAERVRICCGEVTRGGICPKCQRGKTYPITPQTLVRVTAEAPLSAKVYELEKLRCNTCGAIFTAKLPEGETSEKYDSKSIAMLALLHYGTGMPFNRLEKLQGSLGIPLSSSTQWDMVSKGADPFFPVFDHLIHEAAQGQLMHNDDTTVKILEMMGKRSNGKPPNPDRPDRKGMFTTAIVSKTDDGKIAIFCTGTRHAGENLEALLRRRKLDLPPPIQMCDGLEHNVPKEFETILSNCNAHSRRKFVEILDNFPVECRYVILEFLKIYRNDAHTRDEGMTDDERLIFHQQHSKKVMEDLKEWMRDQFENRVVEPNSGLGQAFTYFLKRWDSLTLFLRKPGVPSTTTSAKGL